MSQSTPSPGGYRPHLDALRAVAILVVLADHLFPLPDWPVNLAPLGVKLFFVLSGYLITGILLENRAGAEASGVSPGHVLRQFYVRRFLRIFPIYYLAIGVCLVFDLGRSRELWPWLVTYTTNLFMGRTGEWPVPMSHGWSLAVEEQFYIFWPLLVLWLPWRWMAWAIAGTVVFGSAFKVWAFASGANDFVCWFSTPGSLDALGAGALIALWQRAPRSLPGGGGIPGWLPSADFAARAWVPWAGLALVALAEIPPPLNGTSPLVELPRIAGFSLVVLHASHGFGGLAGRIAGNRWVVLTGMLSYGLYLYHPIVHVFCQRGLEALSVEGGTAEAVEPVLALALSFVAAGISFRFFERPINNLKRHFPYVDARAAVPPPAPPKGYRPQLDGLRGLAILMVFFHHSGLKLPHSWDWGQMGVRLFFVLSGYLITLSLWKIEDRSAQLRVGYAGELAIFQLRRIARLLPAFLAALAFGCLAGMQDVIEPLLWHLAFLTNFKIALQGWFFGPTAHLWSIALQEQFYILWPFFLLAVPRRVFPYVALALVAGGYGYRVFCMQAGLTDYWRWLMVPGSIDTFAIGGLIAWAQRGPGLPPLPSRPLPAAGLVLLAAACWGANRALRFSSATSWLDALPEIFEGVVAAILVWGCVQGFRGIPGRFFECPPLRFIGRISYGIFIYHLVLFFFMEPFLDERGIGPKRAPVVWSVLMFGLTFLVAAASWHWLENPAVRASKRFIESLARRGNS